VNTKKRAWSLGSSPQVCFKEVNATAVKNAGRKLTVADLLEFFTSFYARSTGTLLSFTDSQR
jgi:hypothetical protein